MEGKDASEIAGYLTGAGVLDAGKHATLCGKQTHSGAARLGTAKADWLGVISNASADRQIS
jgi:hypothetical protein